MWKIQQTFKWASNHYNVYLNPSKSLNPFEFTFPVTWRGHVSGSINNVNGNENGDIELIQNGYGSFEIVSYPTFANGVYANVLNAIEFALREMN